MDKPVLNLDQLIVESFATLDTYQAISPGIFETGCVPNCGSGGGFGGC